LSTAIAIVDRGARRVKREKVKKNNEVVVVVG
jgi:hypothetical protein